MEPTSKLSEIWVLMSGIPQRRIGDFLAMWALGTLFGKTIKVDMAFTREKGVLHILFGCLDYTRIPSKERIFTADGFYDISFEDETPSDLEMPTTANQDDDPSDNNGNGNNGDHSNTESQNGKDAMDTDINPNQMSDEGTKGSTSSGPDINKLAGDFSLGVKFSPSVKIMMEQSRVDLRAFVASLTAPTTATVVSPMTAVVETKSVSFATAA
jgi:hypothetical protein